MAKFYRSSEGYSDPTAGIALGNLINEERMKKRKQRRTHRRKKKTNNAEQQPRLEVGT